MLSKARIAVLVSGGGTNLQALIDAQKSGVIKSGEICLVISNVEGAYALERARNNGIEALTITRRAAGSQEAFEQQIDSALKERGIAFEEDGIATLLGFEKPADAAAFIAAYPALCADFEYIKGSMDDVFLAVTGKKLGGNV